MAVYLTVEDPEALEPVPRAYCALTEVHANYKTKSLVVIFECWRNKQAFEAKRRSFTAIQVQFEANKGGEHYFQQYGLDGGGMTIGPNILHFCRTHSELLRDATPINDAADWTRPGAELPQELEGSASEQP
jgi:hypothetical protein